MYTTRKTFVCVVYIEKKTGASYVYWLVYGLDGDGENYWPVTTTSFFFLLLDARYIYI